MQAAAEPNTKDSRFPQFQETAVLSYLAAMKMKDLGLDERPMEKLLDKGSHVLSNVELLAVLLRSGTVELNAMDVARLVLGKAEGSFTKMSGMSKEGLMEVPGIGMKKAATLMAAFELGRRFVMEGSRLDKTAITGPEMIFRIMVPRLKGLPHEECWAIWLNRANYIIGKEMITSGGFSSTTLDTRMIVLKAMEKRARGVIIIHNHPSGNPRPGDADIRQTKALKDALAPMDIDLMDHVIICDDCFYSFADERVAEARP